MRRSVLAAGLSLLFAVPVMAQSKGTWEIGGFGRYNWYPSVFNQVDSSKGKNSFGGGARVGWFVADNWSLELDGSANATDLDRSGQGAQSVGLVYLPFHLRGIYNAPLSERFAWLFGLGLNYNRYDVSSDADQFLVKKFEGDDWGVGGLTGFRWRMADWLAVRVDGTADYIPSPHNEDSGHFMVGVQAGLSLMLGGKCRGKIDSVMVDPRRANARIGESVTFRVVGYDCDGSTRDVSSLVNALVATANGTMSGTTFTCTNEGQAQLSFDLAEARKKAGDVAVVTCTRPAPPPVTLTSCDLQPNSASILVGETTRFRVVGSYSDGTTRDLTDAQLTADGGSLSNGVFSSNVAGTYTVTANCAGGRSDRSTITVRSLSITVQALFEFNKTNVYVAAELEALRSLARTLRDQPGIQLEFTGHTDSVGSDAYNCSLGWRRIQAVVDSLRSFGAPENTLNAAMKQSYGERQPVVDNTSAENRAKNRRVEITTPGTKQYDSSKACAAPRR